MSKQLISELRTLVQISKKLYGRTDPQIDLTDPRVKCPDEITTSVEKIKSMSITLFGMNREPSNQQKREMDEAGFTVCAGDETPSGWIEGVILTPVGQIRY